ncbi:TraI/MobA(P) family conjugative relaxase [Acidocella facilis]|uniref:TraI/MobA(P) family conjugative relaxase n=1 Tax=Acidocella facilis TaxID=525 RepID=UPI00068E805A|nr:TraI/MobA(P) family conjugative relaxase [Acidocella facilis]
MIAKRIARQAATSSMARLVRYMVAAEGDIDPQSWARTADYILAARSTTMQGEKVAGYRVTNCGTDDPGDATTLIQATQTQNTKSKADKTYHLVYSFRQGENPPLEVLHQIEDELCEVLGYADHQRISAVHIDTDNLHVHVAVNKVHPAGLQNIEPFYDKQRLMEACEWLEKKFGLEHDDHGLTGERAYDRRNRIRLNPERQHDSRFRAFLRESYARALAEGPEAATYGDLRKLTSKGVAHGPKSYSMLLPGNAGHRVDHGGTQHADGMRRAGNGTGRDGAGIGGAAADMEAQAGIESLTGYIARDVAPAMRRAATWKELHAALAEHGLQIKTRGAGLVIGDPGLGLWCKASECGRDLSLKALTDRLGPFERDQNQRQQREPGSRGYAPRPRQTHPSSAALFTEYQRQQQAAIANRKAGMAAIRAARAAEMERIERWSATQRMIQKVGPRGQVRAAINATTRMQVAAARNAAKATAETETANLYKATPLPNWNQWLMQRAERGEADALDVLRASEERAERMRGDLLTAKRAEKAKTRIMESLRPHARRDGTMAYRTADGGLVLDRTTHVKAERATTGAALVALSLAAERFKGQPLDVQGSDQFRKDVARLAGMHGVKVRFSDPSLEIARQAMVHEKAQAAEKPMPEATGVRQLVDHVSEHDEQQQTERKRVIGRRGRDLEI